MSNTFIQTNNHESSIVEDIDDMINEMEAAIQDSRQGLYQDDYLKN